MMGELTTIEWVRARLSKKANSNVSITGGNGLSGGGTITEDRVITPQYGTTAGTVAAGNHTHTEYAATSHTHTYSNITDFIVAAQGSVNPASLPNGTILFEYEV